jgi:Reverse transcriptase (RNA-dependent DNA polymerase)
VFDKNTAIIANIRAKLKARIELTDLNIAKFFLGIEILRDQVKKAITLTQRGYTAKILQKFTNSLFSKATPCVIEVKL